MKTSYVRQLTDPGLVRKSPEMDWRDYLLLLLRVAAEIEHGLMVQYLYAAYSLGDGERMVEEWRNSIVAVAKEEMGHLLCIQNALCLLGGPMNLSREEYPWVTPFYPFPFKLERFTRDSLSCYIYAEMPKELIDGMAQPREDPRLYKELSVDDVKAICRVVDVRAGGTAHHVSEIYQIIHRIASDTQLIDDDAFQTDTVRFQASWDEWGRGYGPQGTVTGAKGAEPNRSLRLSGREGLLIVAQMGSRSKGLATLMKVAGQGESNDLRPDDTEGPSHYERFAKIYQDFKGINWEPARLVPENPTTLHPDYWKQQGYDSDKKTFIEADTSRTWANLFNLRYRMLLAYLAHAYRLPRIVQTGDSSMRAGTMHRVFAEMVNLKSIAGILVGLPLHSRDDARRAGPPFELPYTVNLPPGERDCWRLHVDLLNTARELCDKLLVSSLPPNGREYLRTMLDLDQASVRWITPVIAGLRSVDGYGMWR